MDALKQFPTLSISSLLRRAHHLDSKLCDRIHSIMQNVCATHGKFLMQRAFVLPNQEPCQKEFALTTGLQFKALLTADEEPRIPRGMLLRP
jgi:hypothetical protein